MACSVEDLCRTSVARVCNARGFPREYFINENTKNRRVFIRSMCKTLACTLYFFIYFIFLLLLLVCARIHYCDRETNCVFWEIIIDYCAGQKLNRTPLKPCNNIRKAYTHTLTFVYAIKKKKHLQIPSQATATIPIEKTRLNKIECNIPIAYIIFELPVVVASMYSICDYRNHRCTDSSMFHVYMDVQKFKK